MVKHNVVAVTTKKSENPDKTLRVRYFCDACTGRAMYAPEKKVFTTIICANCGAECVYNANNWFEVSDPAEFAKINS